MGCCTSTGFVFVGGIWGVNQLARARNIKPSFFQNEDLAELSPLARLFFIGLWTESDYKGCVEFRPRRLKVRLLPYDDCDAEEIANNLERSGFITIYSVGGQKYLKIINFEKHQNPHKNERETGSEIPDVDQHQPQTIDSAAIAKTPEKDGTAREENGTDRADSLFPLPDSGSPPLPPPAAPASTEGGGQKLFAESEKPASKGKPAADETALQAACRETFRAYQAAYTERHGTPHTDNAKVRSQIKQFVQRVPYAEAPLIAAWFTSHTATKYVQNLHTVGFLLSDVDKLRTEWATGRQVSDPAPKSRAPAPENFAARDYGQGGRL